MKPHLELDQIQGIVLSGYGDRPAARYVLFHIESAPLARKWIGRLVEAGRIQFGEYRATPRDASPLLKPLCINIAFTHPGLRALGVPDLTLNGFSVPFQSGMSEPSRARRLGDDAGSDPQSWQWGGPKNDAVHGVLMLYAGDQTLNGGPEFEAFLTGDFSAESGIRVVDTLEAHYAPKSRSEHFGFRDGISNPRVGGAPTRSPSEALPAGEFVLGYENGHDNFPVSPEATAADDPSNALPAGQPGRRDFGKNGTYLVFRQLEQNVQDFWSWVRDAVKTIPGAPAGTSGLEWLGAKIVGRFRDGTPLATSDHLGGDPFNNDFSYGDRDPRGARCPIGAHIRRTNPRDTLLPIPTDVELSARGDIASARKERVRLTNLHRILRRGRSYGAPIDPDFNLEEILRRPVPAEPRGLYFICLNANLQRQFEFVQTNWAMNPTFAGLAGDPDPLLGAERACPFPASSFTLPGYPTRRVSGVRRFVEVRGGAYFFLPSKAALRFLGGPPV